MSNTPAAERRDLLPFLECFARLVGETFPLALPAQYDVFGTSALGEVNGECLIGVLGGTSPPYLLSGLEDLQRIPEGTFFAGFSGHGVSSTYFIFCSVDTRARVFFRLPFGGAHEDREKEQLALGAFLRGYAALLARKELRSILAYDAGGSARYQVGFDGEPIWFHGASQYPNGGFFSSKIPPRVARVSEDEAFWRTALVRPRWIDGVRRMTSKLRADLDDDRHGTTALGAGLTALHLRRAASHLWPALAPDHQRWTAEVEAKVVARMRAAMAHGYVPKELGERWIAFSATHGEWIEDGLRSRDPRAFVERMIADLERFTAILTARQQPPRREVIGQLGNRKIQFEQLSWDDDARWRIVVDRQAVPMMYRETETTLTNSGTYEKELKAAHPVEYLPLKPVVVQKLAFENPMEKNGSWSVSATWVASTAEMYNTVIYSIESIRLAFFAEFSRVEITWNHHTDMSD